MLCSVSESSVDEAFDEAFDEGLDEEFDEAMDIVMGDAVVSCALNASTDMARRPDMSGE